MVAAFFSLIHLQHIDFSLCVTLASAVLPHTRQNDLHSTWLGLAWQVDAIEAQSRAQAQQLQEQWERRFEEALSAVKAEEQAKAYVQEVRVEQLMQRLAAVEQKSAIGGGGGGGGGNGGGGRGGGTVSEEKIAVLITSVELLRGQISDLETQLSAVSARRNGNGNGGGGGLGEVEARLRSVEREQQQTLLSMEERLVSQTEAVIER
jgi:hypothetical protein